MAASSAVPVLIAQCQLLHFGDQQPFGPITSRAHVRAPASLLQVHRQTDCGGRRAGASYWERLGPWSLTALGHRRHHWLGDICSHRHCGCGEHFEAPSILHDQVLDLISNLLRTGSTAGALMHGRPPRDLRLPSRFCWWPWHAFAGLCYAELASMIPIAGSAYTYSYATLGEIFAWIIGWDLILEYVVSNVAVAVGFSGYTKAQLAASASTCQANGRARYGLRGSGPGRISMCPVF